MSLYLQYFIWLPLIGFLGSLCIPRLKESWMAGWAMFISMVFLISSAIFSIVWMANGAHCLNQKHVTIFQAEDIEIFIDFYFDATTAVFAFLGAKIMWLIAKFSKYYLHRDQGFKRFYTISLLFFLSYMILIFSGNFETLFLGWEVLGICSFLLIGFYSDRYLPVKNSLKVISLYRLGDICLILAMWMSHHLWHENITFEKLNSASDVIQHVVEHKGYAFFIATMIVVAAAIKSAQWPFSSWLPRAMEGPTSSSALFYGALSVHMGIFLLLRTYPYWESMVGIKWLIILIGIVTSIIAHLISGVQSSVKSQIAYASVAQIGLMMIEVALGWHALVLIHLSGNMLLRTYQLLVSPSVLSYALHNMVFDFQPRSLTSGKNSKWRNTVYIWSVKEWGMDMFQRNFLWRPFKSLGRTLTFMTSGLLLIFWSALILLGGILYYHQEWVSVEIITWFPHLFSTISFMLILAAFSDKGDARHAWGSIMFSHLFLTLSIAYLNENFGHNHIALYLSGTIISAVVGYFCLRHMYLLDGDIQLNRFHGYVYEKPIVGAVFLIACFAFLGLPFTPTFIGIDILFSHIHKHEEIIIVLTALSFLVIEIAVLRIYARVFLGQHKKTNHAMAYRSS